MKKSQKDDEGNKIKSPVQNPENKRAEKRSEDKSNFKEESSKRNRTGDIDQINALSQGYFPDGPGGSYRGV